MAKLPAYELIRRDIAEQIAGGIYVPPTRIPSESRLAEQYGVTRMTVRQAVTELVREGLLIRRQGLGTYVAEAPHVRAHTRLRSFVDEVGTEEGDVDTVMVAQLAEPPPPNVAEALGAGRDAMVTKIARVRRVRGVPVAYQISWLPFGRCPALAREELVDGSLYTTLERNYGIVLMRAEERIAAVAATRDQAERLEVGRRSPLLEIQRRAFDRDNVVVEFAHSVMRTEYSLATMIER